MAFHLERATTADFLKVAALDRIAWPEAPDTFIPDGEHVWRVWCEYAYLLVCRQPEANLLHSADIAGALVMFPTLEGENFLHKIMVHPDCRGRGMGTALLYKALEWAERPVLLTVDLQNEPAVRLYRNLGFEVRKHVPDFYRPHEDRAIMVHPRQKADL